MTLNKRPRNIIRVGIETLIGDTINLNDEEPGSTCDRMPYFNFVTEHPALWGSQVDILKYSGLFE